MRNLREFRAGKAAFYPDQAVYAGFACAEFGLEFESIDGGSGLVFRAASKSASAYFGAGRCSWYPQNNATAATLASDKYFANCILEARGIPNLGGDYFFLSERHRSLRPAGHERTDAFVYLERLGSTAFVKPLTGSRGDFAQIIRGEDALYRYLLAVAEHYDAVLMQPVASGQEYRIFLLDGEAIYSARKLSPTLVGDGVQSVRDLLAAHNVLLKAKALSPIDPSMVASSALDDVLPPGGLFQIKGRTNLSAGGRMTFETPRAGAAMAMAKQAVQALGLRAAAVDLFTDIGGNPDAVAIIEVNSNPSIRLLEDLQRPDLILKIWRHTFSALGLLD
jgi:hypothetical protein